MQGLHKRKQANRAFGIGCLVLSPLLLTCKLTPLPSVHSAPALAGWQRNWICRGAQRPENPVTCFPVEKGGGASHQRGPPEWYRKSMTHYLRMPTPSTAYAVPLPHGWGRQVGNARGLLVQAAGGKFLVYVRLRRPTQKGAPVSREALINSQNRIS